MQLVHRNTKYGSMDNAKDKSDGISVIAIMFMVCDEDPTWLKGVVNHPKLCDVSSSNSY